MKHGISDELYVSIYEGFSKGGIDVVLSQVLTDIRKLGLFSVETLELLRDTVNSELSSRQHAYLRTSLKARDDEKVNRVCRYISLSADGTPSISFGSVTNIANLAESAMVDVFVSGQASRIGIAHALLALRYSPPASGGHVTTKLIELYPDIIRLFAEHNDRVIDIHEFIAERKLKLETNDDFDQIREFLELDAPSLSSGLL